MTLLPQEAVTEFIKIHQQNTGVLLTLEEATSLAQKLFDGLRTLFEFKVIEKDSD